MSKTVHVVTWLDAHGYYIDSIWGSRKKAKRTLKKRRLSVRVSSDALWKIERWEVQS